jgi:hypothetical protein
MSGRVGAGGVTITIPSGWDGRARAARAAARNDARAAHEGGGGVVLHAGSFALPSQVGEYGSGAVERMTSADVLLCLIEHDPADAAQPLFRRQGVPAVRAEHFDANAMQRVIPGMAGAQWFFRVGERAFCLYGVVGSHRTRQDLAPRLARVVRTLEIS